jgi:hypothetical protein
VNTAILRSGVFRRETGAFRRELDAHQLFFAMGEVIAHLHFLLHRGKLRRSSGADGILRFVGLP